MPARNMNKDRGRANFFRLGDNNIVDDRSGFKIKASTGRFEWNMHFVGDDQWEERQPLDLLRGFPDKQAAAVSRPGNPDQFLAIGDVDPNDL